LADRKPQEPYYGDDFWDWAYVIEAFYEVNRILPDADPGDKQLRSEAEAFFKSVKAKVSEGLTFRSHDEWFGPATPTAVFRALFDCAGLISEKDQLLDVLEQLKQQALTPIREEKYYGRDVVPPYHVWHYGQVVHTFDGSHEQLDKIRELDTFTGSKLEKVQEAWGLARAIQGLHKAGDDETRDEAIRRLIACEDTGRAFGTGLVSESIKASLNALEAVWPIVVLSPQNSREINGMVDALLGLYKEANVVGVLVAVDREAEECSRLFQEAGAEVKLQGRPIRIEHKDYRVVVEKGKAIVGAMDATLRLIDTHHAKWLIMVGIAGSLAGEEKESEGETKLRGPRKGDVVLGTSVAPYRIREKVRQTVESVHVPLVGLEWETVPLDPNLFRIAHEQGPKSDLSGGTLHEGLVVTGTGIKDSLEEKHAILDQWPGALAIEEEGYIVGLLGLLRGIPAIVVRGISDLAGGDKQDQKNREAQEDEDQRRAAKVASALAVKIVESLSKKW
jgi:nucleoside phosphorylase